MRYIRQRQLKKVNGTVENNRIDLLNKFNPVLDKSFKWHREHDYGENYIEFGDYCLKARLNYSK